MKAKHHLQTLLLIALFVQLGYPQTDFWEHCQLSVSSVSSLFCGQQGYTMIGAGSSGVYGSPDGGITIDSLLSFRPPLNYRVQGLTSSSNGNMFVAMSNSFRSTDHGATWVQLNTIPGFVYDLEAGSFSSSGAIVLGGGGRGWHGAKVVRSIDHGMTWGQPYQVNFDYLALPWISVFPISPSGVVLAGTRYNSRNQSSPPNYGLIRSIDYGATWDSVAISLSPRPEFRGLAWKTNGDAYAATSRGVLRTTDIGSSWEPVNALLPALDVRCIALNSSGHIFIGTGSAGVFFSTDSGSSWIQQNAGITDTTINAVAFTPDEFVLVGTEHSGMFRSIQSTMSVETPPSTLSIGQNYPNPFNTSTTISYILTRRSYVSLKIFDVLGREIQTIVNENQEAGYKSISFDAKALPSGVYFYRIVAGDFIETKKMVVMR